MSRRGLPRRNTQTSIRRIQQPTELQSFAWYNSVLPLFKKTSQGLGFHTLENHYACVLSSSLDWMR